MREPEGGEVRRIVQSHACRQLTNMRWNRMTPDMASTQRTDFCTPWNTSSGHLPVDPSKGGLVIKCSLGPNESICFWQRVCLDTTQIRAALRLLYPWILPSLNSSPSECKKSKLSWGGRDAHLHSGQQHVGCWSAWMSFLGDLNTY